MLYIYHPDDLELRMKSEILTFMNVWNKQIVHFTYCCRMIFFAWRHLLCVRFNFKLLGNSHSWSGYIYGNDFFLRVSIPKLAIPTHLLPLLSHGRETNATFLCVGIFPLGVLNLRFKASTKPWDCHHAHVLEIAKLYAYFLCFLYVEVAMRLFILPAFFPFYLASKRRLNKYKKRTPKVVVALCLCIK